MNKGLGCFKFEIANISYKDFKLRPKNKKKRIFGKKFTDLINAWLLDLDLDFIYDEIGPVDFVFPLGIEMEAKRLVKTNYKGYPGLATGWLKKEVKSRFSEDAKVKILCITEKKWDKKVDRTLDSWGIHVIETGQVNSQKETLKTEESFTEQMAETILKHIISQILLKKKTKTYSSKSKMISRKVSIGEKNILKNEKMEVK